MTANNPETAVSGSAGFDVSDVDDKSVNERNLALKRMYLEIEGTYKQALEDGDEQLARRLEDKMRNVVGGKFLADNEGLARSMARLFIRPGETHAEDYVQDAREGLWQAFTKWDPDRGVTFGTFSRLYLAGKVQRGVRVMEYNNISHSDFGAAKHVKDAVRELTEFLERSPSNAEVREYMSRDDRRPSCTEALIDRVRQGKSVSLDTPVGDGDGTLGDLIADRAATDMSEMDEIAWWGYLKEITKDLNPDELLVLARRKGWDGAWRQSLVEVASLTGEGRGTVSRKEAEAERKLTGPAPAPLN